MKNGIGLVLWIAVSMAAGLIGSRFLPGEWYASLLKPSWTPPNGVFAPVWTTLYVLMGIAAWLVWRKAGFAGAPFALGAFVAQLGLNALWSYLFFGAHRPDIAFVDITALWVLIVVTAVSFGRVNTTAGALLVPYLFWVSFASALNFALWRMNV